MCVCVCVCAHAGAYSALANTEAKPDISFRNTGLQESGEVGRPGMGAADSFRSHLQSFKMVKS